MSGHRKYHLFTLGVVAGGVLLIATELTERLDELLNLRDEIALKEQLTEESLIARERALQAREMELTSLLSGSGGEMEPGETGVVGFLNSAARRQKVRIETLVPASERKGDGHISEIPITMEVRGSFEGLGRFVSEMERAPLLFHVASCEVKRGEKSGELTARIETTAVLVEKDG